MNSTEMTALNRGTVKKGMIGELAQSHVQDSAMNVILMYLSPQRGEKNH